MSADDIDDPNAYSIEDAKLKAEHDRYMKEAEAKKSEERQKLAKLRSQFQELIKRNDDLPKSVRLDRSVSIMKKPVAFGLFDPSDSSTVVQIWETIQLESYSKLLKYGSIRCVNFVLNI